MRYLKTILIILLLVSEAHAQTSTSTSGTIDISSAMSVTITNLTGIVSFDTPDDYTNGQTLLNAASVAVKSNVNWLVTVNAQSAYFQAMTQGASTDMPASVLKIRRNGTSSYITMTTTAQTLKTGSKGNAGSSGNTFNTDVNISPGFNYNSGTYNIGVLFTISQQ